MGWSDGTVIFDAVVKEVINSHMTEDEQFRVLVVLADKLRDGDWDTLDESEYIDDPLVHRVFVDIGWFSG